MPAIATPTELPDREEGSTALNHDKKRPDLTRTTAVACEGLTQCIEEDLELESRLVELESRLKLKKSCRRMLTVKDSFAAH